MKERHTKPNGVRSKDVPEVAQRTAPGMEKTSAGMGGGGDNRLLRKEPLS